MLFQILLAPPPPPPPFVFTIIIWQHKTCAVSQRYFRFCLLPPRPHPPPPFVFTIIIWQHKTCAVRQRYFRFCTIFLLFLPQNNYSIACVVTNASLVISALPVDLTSIFRWSSPNMQCNKTFTRDMVNLFRPYAAFAADRVLIIKHLFVTCLDKTPPRPSNNASFLPRPQISCVRLVRYCRKLQGLQRRELIRTWQQNNNTLFKTNATFWGNFLHTAE